MSYWKSTIGLKQIMAVTGLMLSLFVLSHVSGNFLIFKGAEAYNSYSYFLMSNPFIVVIELGLLSVFLLHFLIALTLTVRNRKARDTNYKTQAQGHKKTSFFDKTLWSQGVVILVFTIFHLITFKYGPYHEATYNGVVMRDLFLLVVEVFQSPAYVVFYIFSLFILTVHLYHGLESSFSSLGLKTEALEKKIKTLSLLFSLFVGLGFASQPIYVFLFLK